MTIVAPPSVQVIGKALVSVANSVSQESVYFEVATCDGHAPRYEAALAVVVNLAQDAYDIDVGAQGTGLALQLGA